MGTGTVAEFPQMHALSSALPNTEGNALQVFGLSHYEAASSLAFCEPCPLWFSQALSSSQAVPRFHAGLMPWPGNTEGSTLARHRAHLLYFPYRGKLFVVASDLVS